MLTMFEVSTPRGEVERFRLGDVTQNGFSVLDIQGLDPVKATIVSSSFAQQDGSQYQSSRRENRNLVLKLGFEPFYLPGSTVKSLRDRLYQLFMPKSSVTLRFYMASGLRVDISGRVESLETPLFSKEPEVDISIICFDPDFVDDMQVVLSGLTTSTDDMTEYLYEGTVETGFTMQLHVDRAIDAFSIYHRLPTDELHTLDVSLPLLPGDVLTLSTVPGERGATLTRDNVDSSALYGVSPYSKWLELMPGYNGLRVYAEGAGIPFDITYNNRYGGL